MVQAEDLTKLSEPEAPYKPEKRTLLSKYNIPVQYLEFEYIEKCQNGRELEKILKILKSGEEGYFPDLLKCAEKRLAEIKPKSKYLQKVCPVLSKTQLEKEEWNTISNDLSSWMQDVNDRDKELRDRKLTDENVADAEVRKTQVGFDQTANRSPPKRISSTDYESWDKYDPDAEILKMDLEEEKLIKKSRDPEKHKSKKSKSVSFNHIFATEAEAKFQATSEKERGNDCFKAGEYRSALQHYTNSIKCKPLAASYTNRALVYNKLKMYSEAIIDCKATLRLEPNNIKAYLRMAEAHDALEEYEIALASVESAIQLDPNNTFAQQLANRLRSKVPEGLNRNKRYIIEDAHVESPKAILKNSNNLTDEVKSNNSDVLAKNIPKQGNKKRNIHKTIAIPGSSKMAPPFYKVVSNNDPKVIETEEKRILNKPHLLHLTNIDVHSEEEDEQFLLVKVDHGTDNHTRKSFIINDNEEGCVKTKDVTKLKTKRKFASSQPAQVKIYKVSRIRMSIMGISGTVHQSNKEIKINKNVNYKEKEKQCVGDSQDVIANCIKATAEELQLPYTFIETWNSIRKDQTFNQHAEILRKLNFSHIHEVIGYKLDDEILSSFIQCLHRHFMVPGELDKIESVLINMTRIPRFKIITLFLKDRDWRCINQLIEFLNQHGRNLPDDIKKFYST